jgi:iron complex transport system substrate-binding protein
MVLKMKRRTGMFIGLGLIAVILTGCGANKETAAAGASQAESTLGGTDASEPAKGGTHTFKAVNGLIEIPDAPQRVVVRTYLGEVMVLGVPVVGSEEWSLANPYLDEGKKAQIKDVGYPMNVEEVLALDPDLIITDSEEGLSEMEKIAPTVFIPFNTNRDIKSSIRYFGEMLNKQSEAEEWIKAFETEAAIQAERLKEAGMDRNASVGLFEFANGKVYAFGDNMGRGGQVLTSGLGMKLQEMLQEVSDGQGWAEISIEALSEYAPDYMFVTIYTANGEPSKDVEEMKKTSVWKSLPAVQNNRVIELPFEKIYYYDPVAVLQQLKIITDSILNTMK